VANVGALGAAPSITVCIPTIGRLEFLDKTLESLAHQTLQPTEILVLDNESPPKAYLRLREFADGDARVQLLRAEPRMPMFANFNRGIRAARGDYLVFFHDDDVYGRRFLERLVGFLQATPTAGFAGSNYYLIDAQGQVFGRRRLIKRTEVVPGRRFIADLIRSGRAAMPTPGIVFRRSALGPEGFDEQLPIYFGDFVVLMHMAERHDVILVEEPLLNVRLHASAGSVSAPVSSSESVALRTALMDNYLTSFASRSPEDAAFVGELRRALRRSNRIGYVWGWVSARNDHDAAACLERLASSPDRALATTLQVLGRFPLGPGVRRAILTPILRRLGRSVT
jgi:glycosyltransferase involved in cell wall biosynthesis